MSIKDDDLVFRALGDPTRRALLDLLRNGPCTTGELADQFDVTRFAVMKHLQVLVDAGLVLVERRGRERINTINAVPIQQIYRRWIRRFEGGAADRLLDLKDHVERPPLQKRKARRA